MKKVQLLLILTGIILLADSFSKESLRSIYSRPPATWPAPAVEAGVSWTELGVLPAGPLAGKTDSLKKLIELGKSLFFDTRLSGSGKISCATCHLPELNWTDGKEKAIGHEGTVTKRNSPTIQNSWFYKKLFWDGRAHDLEDQAFAPINSESEMHNEMHELVRMLRRHENYSRLFREAYHDDQIDADRIAHAIALFEQTISGRPSRFDEFLQGDKKALTNSELRGLNLFRTKARCINCHNGPLFSDNQFHNSGFSGSDPGLFRVTHKEEDMGRFKTPSLRDVSRTGPWMHDGSEKDLATIIEKYNTAGFPAGTDKLLRPLNLNKREKADLLAFLKAISAAPADFVKPVLPE